MDSNDVSPYEMSELLNISDGELEALCAGQVPSDDERLGNLAGFLADFAEAHPEPSTECYEEAHLAAMFQTAHLMADKGDPVAMPASKAHGPAKQASGLPQPGRETMFSKFKNAPLYLKIASSIAAFMLMFSGVAAAGALPGPVQAAVADGVAAVGIDLPGGADEATTEVEDDLDDPSLVGEDPEDADANLEADEADDDAAVPVEDETDVDDDADDPSAADEDADVDADVDADDDPDDSSAPASHPEADASDDDPADPNTSDEDSRVDTTEGDDSGSSGAPQSDSANTDANSD